MRLVNLQQLREAVNAGGKGSKKRLLGLDVGVKHVGVAVSDADCRIAIPVRVLDLQQSTFPVTVQALKSEIQKHKVGGLVIGYPIDLAGLRTSQTVKVDDFVARLQKTRQFDNLVFFWEDERFTSKVVESVLRDYKLQMVEWKCMVDKFSAVNILQVCLDRLSRFADQMADT